jgi:hypothetical protein
VAGFAGRAFGRAYFYVAVSVFLACALLALWARGGDAAPAPAHLLLLAAFLAGFAVVRLAAGLVRRLPTPQKVRANLAVAALVAFLLCYRFAGSAWGGLLLFLLGGGLAWLLYDLAKPSREGAREGAWLVRALRWVGTSLRSAVSYPPGDPYLARLLRWVKGWWAPSPGR